MKLGVPYQGSKRKIADKLLGAMLARQPKATAFVDLFGGGGAMSFAALQSGRFEQVVYNDLNRAVVSLLEKILSDGVTPEFYEWTGREAFFELIKGTCWRAGFAQTCWSFGNDGRSYLYSEKIEGEKKKLHDLLVSGGGITRVHEKRREVRRKHKKRVEHLERLLALERSAEFLKGAAASRGKLELSCMDYRQVPIPESAVVYCDIPYKSAKGYAVGGFDFDAFYDWVKSRKHNVFVSSYESPLPGIYEIEHMSLMGPNDKKVIESLFMHEEPK